MTSPETIEKTLELLHPNGVIEVRSIGGQYTKSGYFKDRKKLAKSIAEHPNDVWYTVMNEINDGCYSRIQREKILSQKGLQTTSDTDIDRLNWVLVDADPIRPSGVSSTFEEKKYAFETIKKVQEFLHDKGFKEPVGCDSGNGFHLLYRIDTDTKNSIIIKKLLSVLDNLFSDDKVQIDKAVFNPARITKVYGTVARKGADTEDRPHRESKILHIPHNIHITPIDVIEKLCDEYLVEEQTHYSSANSQTKYETLDIDKFLYDYSIGIDSDRMIGGTRKITLTNCPFNSSHTAPDSCIFVYGNGAISFKCLHNSCADYKWQDLRAMYEPKKIEKKATKSKTTEKPKEEILDRFGIGLEYDTKGGVKSTIDNFYTILSKCDEFDCIRYNAMTNMPEKIIGNSIELWGDHDDAKSKRIIEKRYKIHSDTKFNDAMCEIMKEREYNPIKDIIDNQKWDGVERLENFFIKWLKCEDTDYAREVTRLVFAGGIHRLYNPGCKFDDVCVFVGKQGAGKSTFVQWLAIEDRFYSTITEIEGQKGVEALDGVWIGEISELMAVTRAKEVESVKAYITATADKMRRAYARRVELLPRKCIFIATTNNDQFLTDKTGNRRWYPLKVNCIGYDIYDNEKEIKAEILQCWAEAKYKMEHGKMPHYAKRDLLSIIREKQAGAVEDDPRDGLIEAYLEDKDKTCVLDVWKYALNEEMRKPTKKESIDISMIIQNLGFVKTYATKFEEFGSQKTFIRKYNNSVENIENELPF